MHLDDVGEVIATRKLYLPNKDGTRKEVVVRIGKPQPFPNTSDQTDCYCPYQVHCLGSERVRYAAGVDGVQAIQLVMVAIGAELEHLKREHGHQLRWEADESGDLGFPTTT